MCRVNSSMQLGGGGEGINCATFQSQCGIQVAAVYSEFLEIHLFLRMQLPAALTELQLKCDKKNVTMENCKEISMRQ